MKRNRFDVPIGHARPSVPVWDNEKTPAPKRGKPKKRRQARVPVGVVRVEPVYRLKRREKNAMSWRQLCVTTGKCYSAWWYQVNRYGMSPLDALKHRPSPVVMALRDICKKVGMCPETLQYRRDTGWGFREALLTPVDEIYSEVAKRPRPRGRQNEDDSDRDAHGQGRRRCPEAGTTAVGTEAHHSR